MPFTCCTCKRVIDVGLQEMIVDDAKRAFHKSCFEADAPSVIPAESLSVTYSFFCQRCGGGIATTATRSCSRCYLDLCPKCEAAGCCGSRPASIGEKTYCSSCGRPCISKCPACGKHVHAHYGMFNQNCGGQHEETCVGARELRRMPPSNPPVLLPVGVKKKAGKKKAVRKKAGTRR